MKCSNAQRSGALALAATVTSLISRTAALSDASAPAIRQHHGILLEYHASPQRQRQMRAADAYRGAFAPRRGTRAPVLRQLILHLAQVAGVDPPIVAVEMGADPAPVTGALYRRWRSRPSTSWVTCSARTRGSARTGAMAARAMAAGMTDPDSGTLLRRGSGRALATERDPAEGADQADEGAAVGAGISLGRTLFPSAGAALHGIMLVDSWSSALRRRYCSA